MGAGRRGRGGGTESQKTLSAERGARSGAGSYSSEIMT